MKKAIVVFVATFFLTPLFIFNYYVFAFDSVIHNQDLCRRGDKDACLRACLAGDADSCNLGCITLQNKCREEFVNRCRSDCQHNQPNDLACLRNCSLNADKECTPRKIGRSPGGYMCYLWTAFLCKAHEEACNVSRGCYSSSCNIRECQDRFWYCLNNGQCTMLRGGPSQNERENACVMQCAPIDCATMACRSKVLNPGQNNSYCLLGNKSC